MRLINYVRREVAAGRDPLPAVKAATGPGAAPGPNPWDGDDYLMPVLPEDPLLFHDYEQYYSEGWVVGRVPLGGWVGGCHWGTGS